MRGAFVETLLEMAQADERVFLLTADLGWSVLEPFARAFPRRFLNVGVAEQNLAGIATGLAQVGFVPFIYSIANFVTMRCFEQIRNGPVLHALPVRVIGVGGGYAYGHAGPTHHAVEDLCICRSLAKLTVVAPSDPAQTRAVIRATTDVPGPVYVRVGKGGNPPVPGLDGRFAWDRPELVRHGSDVLFVVTGALAVDVVAAADRLEQQGVSAAVAVVAHLPPEVPAPLVDLLNDYPAVVAVEEGIGTGGLGALVAQTIASHGLACRFEQVAVRDPFPGVSGRPAYLLERVGLSVEHFVHAGQRLTRPLRLAG